jgi:ABC-2 type transport system permease protein
VLFYATPILYVIERLPEKIQQFVILNPMAAFLTQVRHVFIDPSAPSARDVAGGWAPLAVPVGIICGLLVLGFWVFNREAPRIAEEL